jgi:hypothetical protein
MPQIPEQPNNVKFSLLRKYAFPINEKKRQAHSHLASARNYFLQVSRYTRANRGDFRLLWKVLLSGYVPQYLYERAAIDTSLPLQEFEAPISHQRCRTGG